MADGNRVYPVNLVVMHHSVGNEFINASDLTVQDWFDRVGKSRGYKGLARSYHRHPSRNRDTFSQAHFALRRYTKDKNKYGWRLTLLMKDPFNNVAWHAGNWGINQRSIGIETCGNYVGKKLPIKALMLVADKFRKHDKSIGGVLNITYHSLYSATACPGQIAGQVKTIINMINHPTVWNKKIWPPPKPKPPAPKPKPSTKIVKKYVRYGVPLLKVFNKDANLWDFGKTGWSFRVVKRFKKGAEFLAVGEAQHSNGGRYLMAGYSFGKADKTGVPVFTNGVNLVDLKMKPPVVKPKKPDPLPPPVIKPKTAPKPKKLFVIKPKKPDQTKVKIPSTERLLATIIWLYKLIIKLFNKKLF